MNGMLFSQRDNGPAVSPIFPGKELGAYEAMWLEEKATFKTIADRFSADPAAMPSDFVEPKVIEQATQEVYEKLRHAGVKRYGVRIHHAGDYPEKLRDAKYPVEVLYFQGYWELAETPSVAIVGSRKASPDGLDKAARIATAMVKKGLTVVSGLAEGIDTAALTAAIEAGGQTIAVIGTPLGQYYPKSNKDLQDKIARDYLLISQVPVLRYARQTVKHNRLFFPERNVTMSALTLGTVIVDPCG
ncbi:DNA-processing protein DprA [Rhizobium sp. LjRoot254]|uniref:DNA-processing protein DprA n=1 Tax=Rhizobium sp. LjRoot254 TaxID=3342297 RepID=UPI003ED0C6C9